jgi:hypothetical protein
MKSLMSLWSVAAQDLGSWCCTSTSADCQTARVRFEHEGVSFLTITLPAFCRDFEKSLDEGLVGPNAFLGFRRRQGLPLFLGGFLDQVFDRVSGRLLEAPSTDCIWAIRQLTLMFGKILLDCSPSRKAGAVQKYLECEQDVRRFDSNTLPRDLLGFQRVSNLLFGQVFSDMDREVYNEQILPKHGPGKTADRLLGNQKFDLKEWPARLELVFPFGDHAIPNWRYHYRYDHVSLLEPGAERPVKVVLVPKTLKTPRVIAIEPTAMQYMQQGISEKLVQYLETDKTVFGMIGFLDQRPNQLLAEKGSLTRDLATLDLSEASDRVSNQHVRVMLQRFPHFLEAVDATRSRKADVPGKGVVRLAKFASMGSALCFPVEAMVFLSLIFLGIEQMLNRRITRADIDRMRGQVRVYGDDIVVPVDTVPFVIGTLRSFGFVVNPHKSFWNGKFRESCGKEYFDGSDVSVVRVREVLPKSRTDVPEVVSTVSLRNQLYYAGLWRTAAWLDELLSRILKHYPVLDPSPDNYDRYGRWESASPLLGRHSFLGSKPQRVCPDLHVPLVRGYVVQTRPPDSPVSGEGALLKWFLKRGEQPFADRDHLERTGRPQSVSIKLRWRTPY